MAITIKSPTPSQLPSSKGTLYTCPASTSAIVKLITLSNTGGAMNAVNLYKKGSAGTSKHLIGVNTPLGVGQALEFGGVITLEAGDLIEGDATNANEVDYTLSLVERT